MSALGDTSRGSGAAKTEAAGCQWPGIEHPLYTHYHDAEWGVPKLRDVELFEKLVLEGFQAGLSWLTILKKRDNFRAAFAGFEAERIAKFNERDVARLMADKGIVRNRLKIEATIVNARAYLALYQRTSLAALLWSFLDDGPVLNSWRRHEDIPARTALSDRVSRALKAEGFRFVGPTTTYAFMQSVGMVNDHLTGCARHRACAAAQRAYQPSRVT